MKKTIITFTLLLIATLATTAFAQRGPGNASGVNSEYMEWKLRKDLGLNDQQIEKIQEMRTRHQAAATADREAMRKLMEERRAEMQAKAEKRREELKTVLTPEQYEKWQTMRFEQIENRRQNNRGQVGNRGNQRGQQFRGNQGGQVPMRGMQQGRMRNFRN